MTPSLPMELPVNTFGIEVVEPLPCCMLRFGLPCGNDAWLVLVCPVEDGRNRLIAVCQMCVDDGSTSTLAVIGKTWPELLDDEFTRGIK